MTYFFELALFVIKTPCPCGCLWGTCHFCSGPKNLEIISKDVHFVSKLSSSSKCQKIISEERYSQPSVVMVRIVSVGKYSLFSLFCFKLNATLDFKFEAQEFSESSYFASSTPSALL